MFDKTFVSHQSGPSKITVNENRAPTDDSIRLSEEYREKVRKEFLKAYVFGDTHTNEMNGMVAQFVNSYSLMGQDIYVLFDFNGQHFEIKETLDRAQTGLCRDEAYKFLFDCIMGKVRQSLAETFVKSITSK